MMRLVTDDLAEVAEGFPGEAEMILSAMDAAKPAFDRRGSVRHDYRVVAGLSLFAHGEDAPPVELFTRDVSAGGIGFICRTPLPLGYGGRVRLVLEHGDELVASCSVYRCRPSVNGWYEGAVHFTRRQAKLA